MKRSRMQEVRADPEPSPAFPPSLLPFLPARSSNSRLHDVTAPGPTSLRRVRVLSLSQWSPHGRHERIPRRLAVPNQTILPHQQGGELERVGKGWTDLEEASETRTRGRSRSSRRRWLCSVNLRSFNSDMDCLAFPSRGTGKSRSDCCGARRGRWKGVRRCRWKEVASEEGGRRRRQRSTGEAKRSISSHSTRPRQCRRM